jgi:hypothetical protein
MDDKTVQSPPEFATMEVPASKGAARRAGKKRRTKRLSELGELFQDPGRYVVVVSERPTLEDFVPSPVEVAEVIIRQDGPTACRQMTVTRRLVVAEHAQLVATTLSGRQERFRFAVSWPRSSV